MKNFWKLSASFVSAFKSCAFRCYAQYVLGIRVKEEAETLRMGTNWHRVLEVGATNSTAPCDSCMTGGPDPDCRYCGGNITMSADPRELVRIALNEAYDDKPLSKSDLDWAVERQKLWIAYAGYVWYHEDDDFEVVATEVPFEIPVYDDKGERIPDAVIVGKIDKITRAPNGTLYVDEHKSTSKPIDSGSFYWNHLNLDTQTNLYVYAAQLLQTWGDLEKYGIKSNDPLIAGVRYDVWHKPQIKAKKLSMADTKKFLKTGVYMEEKFKIIQDDFGENWINDVPTETVIGGPKKDQPAVYETAEMYGARYMASIIEAPHEHFARKVIARTEDDMRRVQKQIYNVYMLVKYTEQNDLWVQDENQCDATFKCPYMNICTSNIKLDPKNPPEGFYCMYDKKEKNNATKKKTT